MVNSGGHEEDSGLHSQTKNLRKTRTDFSALGPLSRARNPKSKRRKRKMGEVREMGTPSSYLTGLLHIPSFAPGYK